MAMHKNKYIKAQLEQMDIAKELLTNRYLLSTILSNLYRMQSVMTKNFENMFELLQREENKKEKSLPLASSTRKEIRKEKKRIKIVEQIHFERFAITSTQYDALVNEYGVEIVTEACVMLDGYLRETSTDVKDSFKKLKQWAIHLVMKDRLETIRSDVAKITSQCDYEAIEDRVLALKYIASVPDHMRNIDPAVKYLIKKFNIA